MKTRMEDGLHHNGLGVEPVFMDPGLAPPVRPRMTLWEPSHHSGLGFRGPYAAPTDGSAHGW